ncbi:MAG: HAD-IB family hydrolase [Rhodocyclaceae bacterium]|jgi:HAD superfamily hydrolase (TIGR01490 family)|nr:putative phosphatase [Rhodocyclaceae bacterium]MBZ0143269.1 HAD-IB family hydrolase [Rhodocyclaceae bacterium]MCC6879967.1 HAD family hydrolase [Rhodocyclaceae bacterium]MCL4681478.1 HAD-IB family hydrolase [Rhodocyclaceae bacterium]
MQLALFDLDNTLLAGDSDFEWAQYLISRGVLDREVYEARNQDFYEQYKAGTLDIHEFLDFQLKPLSRHPRRELDAWHADFMATRILPIVTEKGRALVRRHQAEGALTAIVTATNSFVTAPIARAFGIEHLVATEPEQANGAFTGRVSGTPSFREGKIARVGQWLAGLGHDWGSFDRSWFYSDSLNDLPLLGKVTDPVAVDPDPTLESHAREHGWPVISLR